MTFVVPAPDGCNLKCPYCFINQRREQATSTEISPYEYRQFICDIIAREDIAALCIQGFEPLLEKSMPYTIEILQTGQASGIPTSLVTNGTNLSKQIVRLKRLDVSKICTSIDAADAATHDKQRGHVGAFDAAVSGLNEALEALDDGTELTVASVLIPRRRDRLEGMPNLLSKIGIKRWIVTNLQKIDANSMSQTVGDHAAIVDDLCALKKEADVYGIDFVVDDEFSSLQVEKVQAAQKSNLSIRRLQRPNGVFRLLPTGQCSMGVDILKQVNKSTPKWNPAKVNAADFLQSVRSLPLQ